MDKNIKERTYNFALQTIQIVQKLPFDTATKIIGRQLIRSGTSIGANVEEATAAGSKDDFTYKMNIALKEARETHYWLRLLSDSKFIDKKYIDPTITEADEIKKIIGSIVSKMRGKSKPRC
ncbi:MAG: four helix bundle protein [Ignavibacteriales bacterium]|nr:four helix bundle protein [Ignavibacteriales bacterium]